MPAEPVSVDDSLGGPPAEYFLAETLDGLYTPYALRVPEGPGPHPFVWLARGNGGGGISWLLRLRDRFRHITDRLLDEGYACAWTRYAPRSSWATRRAGELTIGGRQGMEMTNRAPLEYEDEVSVLRHVAEDPRIDAGRLLHLGVSHAGEMLLKLCSQYPGLLRAGVAAEPASHEVLMLRLDAEPTVVTVDGLRDIDSLELRSVELARSRIADPEEVTRRLSGVDIPVLVLGRDDEDELQGVFRLDLRPARGAARRRRVADLEPPHPRLHLPRDQRGWGARDRRRTTRVAGRDHRLLQPRQLTTSNLMSAARSRAIRLSPMAWAVVTCPAVVGLSSNASDSADSASILAVSP